MSAILHEVFVGRKSEIRQATHALKNKRHVFVYGPFGIGKTTFGLCVQREMGLPNLVVSLQSTPKQMAETIIESLTVHDYRRALAEGKRHRVGRISRHAPVEEENESFWRVKQHLKSTAGRQLVIVIDNCFKVTRQKLVFLDFLIRQGFRFIVNIESSVKPEILFNLRAVCQPQERIELPRLTARESREMVVNLCRAYKIEKERFDSEAWVKQFNGYPLMIVERLKGER